MNGIMRSEEVMFSTTFQALLKEAPIHEGDARHWRGLKFAVPITQRAASTFKHSQVYLQAWNGSASSVLCSIIGSTMGSFQTLLT